MSVNKPYIVGLTGGIGSGKSTAANMLESLGAFHIDADGISRELTSPNGVALPEIRSAFGEEVFTPDGELDRKKIAALTFSDPAKLRQLESIIHPMVQREMMRKLDEAAQKGAAVALLDVPLLFETGLDALCDETWVLISPKETRISRVMERDGLSRDEAELRIAQQMSDTEKAARADRVIENDRSLDKLKSELTQLFERTKKTIQKEQS